MGYTATETAPEGPSQTQPLYYQNGTTNVKQCLHWNGVVGDPQITDPIKFAPQAGQLEKLTFKLDYVGAFKGFGVNAPAGATVVATDPLSGQNMAVALEVDGKRAHLSPGVMNGSSSPIMGASLDRCFPTTTSKTSTTSAG